MALLLFFSFLYTHVDSVSFHIHFLVYYYLTKYNFFVLLNWLLYFLYLLGSLCFCFWWGTKHFKKSIIVLIVWFSLGTIWSSQFNMEKIIHKSNALCHIKMQLQVYNIFYLQSSQFNHVIFIKMLHINVSYKIQYPRSFISVIISLY